MRFRGSHGLSFECSPNLVAQCSAIGVSEAVTPPCSAIRFRRENQCDTPPLQSHVCPSLSRRLRTQLRQGGGKTGATGSFGGVQRDIPTTSLKLRESAASLYVRHCAARLGSQHNTCVPLKPPKQETQLYPPNGCRRSSSTTTGLDPSLGFNVIPRLSSAHISSHHQNCWMSHQFLYFRGLPRGC